MVWLTCDETDADSLVLMDDLQAAMNHGAPGYRWPPGPLTVEEPAFSRHVLPGFLSSVNSLQPVTVVLDDAIAEFSMRYSRQNEQDYAAFTDAIADGVLPVARKGY